MTSSSENSRIEDLVFDCLSAEDPVGELERRAEELPEAERDRARRALLGVLEQEGNPEQELARPKLPESIAGYRILELLASGGMGVVYLAEQREPVRRRVALKLIREGFATEQAQRRFELERQALAMMDHDNIARIYDADTTADGTPFLVMEYVAGVPITEFCDKVRMSARERLALFEQVCLAVQHAHHRGIIHRDLKPANILIADRNERPSPKIIDFGLARATSGRIADVSMHTQHGSLVGTPAYMSPEQAEMSPSEIDTRTDVYSLGVVLYELLTGTLPLSDDSLRGTPAEIQRRAIESEIPRPSSRIIQSDDSSVDAATKRRSTVRALSRSLRGDLDWVLLKALERDRSRRYPTASEFAADLRRFLENEPVSAGPPSMAYRLKKLIQRNRGKVAAAGAVLVTLVAGIVISGSLYLDATRSLEEFNLLRFRVELDDAVASADELFPARPENAAALTSWIDDQGTPLRAARETVAAAIGRLQGADSSKDRFLKSTLERLQDDLDEFFAPEKGLVADVTRRLEWASSVRERSVDRFASRWSDVTSSLAEGDERLHAGYAANDVTGLDPQVGLVPIGIHPTTGLWEFYHLLSAADPDVIPVHQPDGTIEVGPGTGIVFVLLPGGTAWIGAQRDDENAPNYDPLVRNAELEGPPRELSFRPFFVSRFELTQGQWERLSDGELPSTYRVGREARGMKSPPTRAHPVESVTYLACEDLMRRTGLRLPTEREWAYACRAGTEWTWFTGPDAASLNGYANLNDEKSSALYPDWGPGAPFNDGYIYHAPVGTYDINPFGLHDVVGNVFEWCQRNPQGERTYARGGAFALEPRFCRSAMRLIQGPKSRTHLVGLRPARTIERSSR